MFGLFLDNNTVEPFDFLLSCYTELFQAQFNEPATILAPSGVNTMLDGSTYISKGILQY